MRHRLLTSLVTLALGGVLALPATSNAAPSKSRPGACSAAAARVAVSAETIGTATSATLCLLNRERSRRGLRPLKLDRHLSAVARAHSRDMVRRGYFEHNSPNGRTPFDRILATRYVPRGASWALGENIGWGTEELAQPVSLVKAWMKSPGHRRNILDKRFREIGIGIVTGVPTRDPGLRGQAGATYTTDFGSTAK